MKFLVLFSLATVAVSAVTGKYVFDYMKPALSAAEVIALLSSKEGPQWPTLNSIPDNNFDCSSKKQPGFYADQSTQCQVFHRCDVNGNLTSYLCVNTTVFNQLTLVCDYWYNVDCSKSADVENLANSRLYTDQPLFDSPPADYVAPSQTKELSSGGEQPSPVKPAPVNNKPNAKPAAATTKKAGVKIGGSASISISSRTEDDKSASANANEAGSNVTEQVVEATTAADAENQNSSSAASADQSSAASADETSAASADQSTAAAADQSSAASADTTAASA
jgi:hypothetical protein